ncbi:hypothetical protein [Butyricimonas synergistica]|uniref:hypothetical protein n=1 Tax=Butyricimonas synergistica TaxID=544644 RepID=UPI0003759E25|nr:hypothetical protein [Butyricimonas synergistica]
MELEELKLNWQLLNKQLEKNEILNRKIIQDMLQKRTISSYNKLFYVEIISLAIGFAIIPTFLILIQLVKYPPSLPWIITLMVLFCCIILWTSIKIWWLRKFNMENKNIFQLSKIIYTYRYWTQKEYIVSIFLLIILLTTRFITAHAQNYPWFAILLISITILIPIYMITFYKLFYKKHCNNIQKSLDELKEFKE